MSYKFLFDECLSPGLVDEAIAAGYPESTCIRNRGWAGMEDWRLVKRIVDEDFTFVTHNATDFRGDGEVAPGGHYADLDIHAGLVCLHAKGVLSQKRLFRRALDLLTERPDLINTALEVFDESGGSRKPTVYRIPP